jgi:toxin-antitoxin system PIN domain toxin
MNLPDVNFWIAISFQSHVHHASAKAWMQQAGKQSCCLCRVTQMGFLRLVTNPKVLRGDAVSMAQAWRAFDELISDERVAFAEEPEGIEAAWRSLTQHQTFSPNVWSDAYLAAFAQAADFEVVTFDKGLKQYKNVRVTILS